MSDPTSKTEDLDFALRHGERALVAGQTGSGKSQFMRWFLEHCTETTPFVIYDTKEEPKYETLPNSAVAYDWAGVEELIDRPDIDFAIYRPNPDLVAQPEILDDILYHHWKHHRHVGVVIDELYSFCTGSRPGRGIIAHLTRGRSRGNTMLMGTQRPAWIPLAAISEAQKYFLFKLAMKADRKKLEDAGVIGFESHSSPVKFGFHFFKHGDENIVPFGPVPVEKENTAAYVDASPTEEIGPPKLLWI